MITRRVQATANTHCLSAIELKSSKSIRILDYVRILGSQLSEHPSTQDRLPINLSNSRNPIGGRDDAFCHTSTRGVDSTWRSVSFTLLRIYIETLPSFFFLLKESFEQLPVFINHRFELRDRETKFFLPVYVCVCLCACVEEQREGRRGNDGGKKTRRSHEPIAKDTSGSCNKESMGGLCSVLGQCHPLELESWVNLAPGNPATLFPSLSSLALRLLRTCHFLDVSCTPCWYPLPPRRPTLMKCASVGVTRSWGS